MLSTAFLTVSLLMVGTSSPDTSLHRVTVSHLSSGVVFYHGHELHPPFTLEATFRVFPETTWVASYINGYPLVDRSSDLASLREMKRDSLSKWGRRNWVLDNVADIARAHPSSSNRALADQELSRLISKANQPVPVVDSIVMLGIYSARILWRGEGQWERVECERPSEGRLRNLVPLARAQTVERGLRSGRVVILGSRGALSMIGPISRASEGTPQLVLRTDCPRN